MPDAPPPGPLPHGTEPPDPAGDGGSGRGWKVAAAIAVVAACAAIGVLGSLLLGGGSDRGEPAGDVRACVPSRDFTKEGAAASDAGDRCPPQGARRIDGLVQETDEGGFTLRPLEGRQPGPPVKLHVREPDRPYIDIAHAQTHAALGQPVRVYVERIDGRDSVLYMEDAPLPR